MTAPKTTTLTTRDLVMQDISLLFGYHARQQFQWMPVTEGPWPMLYVTEGGRKAVVYMPTDASRMDWLHETSHYLCWLWFNGLRVPALTEHLEIRAEIAAYLPIAALELLGTPEATDWLDRAFPTLAARARKMVRAPIPLRMQMQELIDGPQV